jgi:hypothetical protein
MSATPNVPYIDVFELSSTTGTGAYVFSNAGSRTPLLPVSLKAGDQVAYVARDPQTNQWESGIGTLGNPPNTLTRTQVLDGSSGAGVAVNWPAQGARELSLSHVAIARPQQATGNTHTVAAGATTSVFTNTTFDGSIGSSAFTLGDIVAALKSHGLLSL